MRESEIEKRLKNAVKMRGGLAFEVCISNFNGVPDRLLLLPEGKAAFAKLKATGRKMRSLQIKRKKAIRSIRVFGVLH